MTFFYRVPLSPFVLCPQYNSSGLLSSFHNRWRHCCSPVQHWWENAIACHNVISSIMVYNGLAKRTNHGLISHNNWIGSTETFIKINWVLSKTFGQNIETDEHSKNSQLFIDKDYAMQKWNGMVCLPLFSHTHTTFAPLSETLKRISRILNAIVAYTHSLTAISQHCGSQMIFFWEGEIRHEHSQ